MAQHEWRGVTLQSNCVSKQRAPTRLPALSIDGGGGGGEGGGEEGGGGVTQAATAFQTTIWQK